MCLGPDLLWYVGLPSCQHLSVGRNTRMVARAYPDTPFRTSARSMYFTTDERIKKQGAHVDIAANIDDDERWTLVPDDEASVIEGLPPNSQRIFGISQEYEDTINYMRRDTTNTGCAQAETLGMTYTTPIPFDPNSHGTSVPQGYHSFRQTITVGLRSPQMDADVGV